MSKTPKFPKFPPVWKWPDGSEHIDCPCWVTGEFIQVPCRHHDGNENYETGSAAKLHETLLDAQNDYADMRRFQAKFIKADQELREIHQVLEFDLKLIDRIPHFQGCATVRDREAKCNCWKSQIRRPRDGRSAESLL